MKTVLFAAATALGLAACASSPSGGTAAAPATAASATAAPTMPAVRAATVTLAPASGSLVSGKLNAMPMADGVHFTGEIGGLTRGAAHAIHVHETGNCSAADASSAGGHFNPAATAHGKVGAGAHHAGDMDNLTADAQGVARVSVHASGVTLGGGARNIVGRAVIVHAAPDDYRSQPAGNAGARVACGIITAVR